MSFDIFDESFYLATNPDVENAVDEGDFSSGLQHFQQFGLAEGRVSVSPLYNEDLYLQANPDVANAVASGVFSSGLQHYIQLGEAEGRNGLFGLYNEQAYLQSYPDIADDVASGEFSSGFQEFIEEGLDEGRFDALFNEQYYLQKYPDVANAVASGTFSSGLQHFLQYGLDEGRSGGSVFNEGFYLRRYPDVANAVASGEFSSGLQHFAQFGEAESRSGTPFNEQAYLALSPEVAEDIDDGDFISGLDQYLQVGQFEDTENLFSGTSGNDIIVSFNDDSGSAITGVEVINVTADEGELSDVLLGSFGVGEVDILIGSQEDDEFYLGFGVSPSNPNPTPLYVGGGNSDYALIRNFDLGENEIVLAGSPSEYTSQVVNGSLNISTSSGDLIGVVEGVTSTLSVDESDIPETFLLE